MNITIIHAGLPRTGTTAIQRMLKEKRIELQKLGIHTIPPMIERDVQNNLDLVSAFFPIPISWDWNENIKEDTLLYYKNMFKKEGIKVISNEDIPILISFPFQFYDFLEFLGTHKVVFFNRDKVKRLASLFIKSQNRKLTTLDPLLKYELYRFIEIQLPRQNNLEDRFMLSAKHHKNISIIEYNEDEPSSEFQFMEYIFEEFNVNPKEFLINLRKELIKLNEEHEPVEAVREFVELEIANRLVLDDYNYV